jgi:hypothetical protein
MAKQKENNGTEGRLQESMCSSDALMEHPHVDNLGDGLLQTNMVICVSLFCSKI